MNHHDESTTVPPAPRPVAEPPEPPPGGVDAAPVGGDGVAEREVGTHPLPRDPDPDDHPVLDDKLPEEAQEGEDTDTRATEGKPPLAPEDESPA